MVAPILVKHLDQAREIADRIGEGLRCLEEAGRLTPEQTRTHRVARAVARELFQLSGGPRAETGAPRIIRARGHARKRTANLRVSTYRKVGAERGVHRLT